MQMLSREAFLSQFDRFQKIVLVHDKGHAFTNFHEGVVAAWEDYKPRLRDHALKLLSTQTWSEVSIGSGEILNKTISAIEIGDTRSSIRNNLILWENRFGHANRDHRMLLEAAANNRLRRDIERQLFDLYCSDQREDLIFDFLSSLTGKKYPLLGYLYFLKDIDRYMPIRTMTFDGAFRKLGIDLKTRGHCNWANYQKFNLALDEIRQALISLASIPDAQLIDAHSFCWLLERLEEDVSDISISVKRDSGRFLGGWGKQIALIRLAVENTVRSSYGQRVERIVKNKELRMSGVGLEDLIKTLLKTQENRCALTGLPLKIDSVGSDPNFSPSVDRIDSSGHYERGNIQIVCRFVNFWKGDTEDREFRRLLAIVRGLEVED